MHLKKRSMYKFKDNQLGLTDFGAAAGMKLNPENRWIKKAQCIPWDEIETRYAQLFSSNKGNVAKPLRLGLGACLIQKEYEYSDEEIVLQIQEGAYLQYFCGYREYDDRNPPVDTLLIMLNTVAMKLSGWIQGAIGCSLSWFSIQIESWVVVGFELCLISTIFKEEGLPPITPAPLQRLLLFVPVILCEFMFLAGMLVWWTPQGANLIEGIQGRYFIPIIPLVLFAIPQVSFKLFLKQGDIRFPKRGFSQILAMTCVLLSSTSLLIQTTVILSR